MKERLLFLICFLCISFMLKAADKPVIKISTENVDLIYRVGNNGPFPQSHFVDQFRDYPMYNPVAASGAVFRSHRIKAFGVSK